MGWKVFQQVTLILTPTHLAELMSKKKDNFNIMITGLVDDVLYVILSHKLNSRPMYDLSTLSFNLYCLCYKLFFTPSHRCYNLISPIPTRSPISTGSFWSRNTMRCRLRTDHRFSGSIGGGAKGVSSRSIKESH